MKRTRPRVVVGLFILFILRAALVTSGCSPQSGVQPEPVRVSAPAPEEPPVRMSWQKPGGFWRWTWPERERFQRVADTWGEETQPWRVLMGSVQLPSGDRVDEAVLLMAPGPEGVVLREHWLSSGGADVGLPEYLRDETWSLGDEGRLVQGQMATFESRGAESRRIQLTPTYVEPAGSWSPDAFDDWVYTTTLLTFEPSVRRRLPTSWRQDGATRERATALWDRVRALLQQRDDCQEAGPCPDEEALQMAIQGIFDSTDVSADRGGWAELMIYGHEIEDEQMLMEIYRRWRPVGRCSMDTRPRDHARAHAELCERRGELGCFVQQGVRLLGDSFRRMVYSSMAERANGTGIQRLAGAGIDTDRLLRGLTMNLSSSLRWPVRPNLSRIARAAVELEDQTRLAEQLQARSQDPTLDDLNRLNAAMTLGMILRRESCRGDEDTCAWSGAQTHIRSLELPPVAQRWLQAQSEK